MEGTLVFRCVTMIRPFQDDTPAQIISYWYYMPAEANEASKFQFLN